VRRLASVPQGDIGVIGPSGIALARCHKQETLRMQEERLTRSRPALKHNLLYVKTRSASWPS